MINGKANERNFGIDALRVFSMFLVVILHILGHGGIIQASTGMSRYFLSFLDIIALCAVDIYALISGYVGYTEVEKKFRLNKVLTIWVQVFFYSFVITLIAYVCKIDNVGLKTVIRSIFPVASNQYWYFSCYIPILILSPWMNHFFRSIDRKKFTKLVFLLFVLFSFFQLFVMRLGPGDPFVLKFGYSFIWLMILYIVGVWMKKCNISEKISSKSAWLLLLLSIVITWLFNDVFTGKLQTGAFGQYISPTILICACSWVIIFSKMQTGEYTKKLISFFAPAAFGVYLIHDNNIIRNVFMTEDFGWILSLKYFFEPLAVLGCAFGILVICLLIEKVRLLLFHLLQIDRVIKNISIKLDALKVKIENKIDLLDI